MYDENIYNVMCEQCGVPEYEIDMLEDAPPHRGKVFFSVFFSIIML